MIEQTYYPFNEDYSSTLSDYSPYMDQMEYEEDSGSDWFAWFLLIAALIGVAGLVYWWKRKIAE